MARLKSGAAAGDLFVGADFFNFGRARDLAAAHGLPLVWANPLKFIRSPERLVLLRAFERKVPYPPEWERFGRAVRRFGPGQEALAMKKFGPEAAGAFRNTRTAAERCAFDFTSVVPPLPADLFPIPLREEVLARLRTRSDLGWSAPRAGPARAGGDREVRLRPLLSDRPRRRPIRPPRGGSSTTSRVRAPRPSWAGCSGSPMSTPSPSISISSAFSTPAGTTRPTSTSTSIRASATGSWPTSWTSTGRGGRERPLSAA